MSEPRRNWPGSSQISYGQPGPVSFEANGRFSFGRAYNPQLAPYYATGIELVDVTRSEQIKFSNNDKLLPGSISLASGDDQVLPLINSTVEISTLPKKFALREFSKSYSSSVRLYDPLRGPLISTNDEYLAYQSTDSVLKVAKLDENFELRNTVKIPNCLQYQIELGNNENLMVRNGREVNIYSIIKDPETGELKSCDLHNSWHTAAHRAFSWAGLGPPQRQNYFTTLDNESQWYVYDINTTQTLCTGQLSVPTVSDFGRSVWSDVNKVMMGSRQLVQCFDVRDPKGPAQTVLASFSQSFNAGSSNSIIHDMATTYGGETYLILTSKQLLWMDSRYLKKPLLSWQFPNNDADKSRRMSVRRLGDHFERIAVNISSDIIPGAICFEFGTDSRSGLPISSIDPYLYRDCSNINVISRAWACKNNEIRDFVLSDMNGLYMQPLKKSEPRKIGSMQRRGGSRQSLSELHLIPKIKPSFEETKFQMPKVGIPGMRQLTESSKNYESVSRRDFIADEFIVNGHNRYTDHNDYLVPTEDLLLINNWRKKRPTNSRLVTHWVEEDDYKVSPTSHKMVSTTSENLRPLYKSLFENTSKLIEVPLDDEIIQNELIKLSKGLGDKISSLYDYKQESPLEIRSIRDLCPDKVYPFPSESEVFNFVNQLKEYFAGNNIAIHFTPFKINDRPLESLPEYLRSIWISPLDTGLKEEKERREKLICFIIQELLFSTTAIDTAEGHGLDELEVKAEAVSDKSSLLLDEWSGSVDDYVWHEFGTFDDDQASLQSQLDERFARFSQNMGDFDDIGAMPMIFSQNFRESTSQLSQISELSDMEKDTFMSSPVRGRPSVHRSQLSQSNLHKRKKRKTRSGFA